MSWLVLCASLAFLSVISGARVNKRVVGGEDAPPGLYPWAVHIKSNQYCGATLISNQWLLTAGHCVYSSGRLTDPEDWHIQAGNVFVRMGMEGGAHEEGQENLGGGEVVPENPWDKPNPPSNPSEESFPPSNPWDEYNPWDEDSSTNLDDLMDDLNKQLEDMLRDLENLDWTKRSMNMKEKRTAKSKRNTRFHWHIAKIIPHPKYDANNPLPEWDIALMKLNKPLPLDKLSNVSTVALPAESTGLSWPNVGQNCVMVGWGCKRAFGSAVDTAQLAQLDIWDNNKCSDLYNQQADLNDDHEFCAGFDNQGQGVCPGDSGSGLVCKKSGVWTVAGVTSATHSRQPGDFPGIFTRVSYFRDWIDEVMRN